MRGPANLRSYGLLIRERQVLIARETVGRVLARKFPGGGVEDGETPEAALVREFREETGLEVQVLCLLHTPGTLLSPWTDAPYTPLYYAVAGDGAPVPQPPEYLPLRFADAQELLGAEDVAGPEQAALRSALDLPD